MKIFSKQHWAILMATAITALPTMAEAQDSPTQWVTGYYAGYFWDKPEYQAPQHVDMSALTHLVFARIGPGGGQMGGRPGQVMPGGGTAQSNPAVGPGAPRQTVEDYMIGRAHASGAKALIMLGGAGDEVGFRASTSAATRTEFVHNLLDFMAAHDYDGIDVDWENISTSDDQAALEWLVSQLRAMSTSWPRYRDKPILITYPTGMLNMNTDRVTTHSVRLASMVDQFNVMSYGVGWFGSGWNTSVFAPLSGYSLHRPMDIASTIQTYVDAGIPRGKIGMGIGFYGMNYQPPFTGPGMSTDGYDPSNWDTRDTIWNYALLNKHGYLDHGIYQWEDASQTGYRAYPGGYSVAGRPTAGYVSYEDAASIAAKGAWARSSNPGQGAGGTIIWLINYGTTNGIDNPLLAAVKQAFLEGSGGNPAPNPAPAISTSLHIDNDWGVGYCATVQITNDGAAPVPWNVNLPFNDSIDALWNGVYAQTEGNLNLHGQDWNRMVAPGEPRQVGLCASRKVATPPPSSPPPPGGTAKVSARITSVNEWTSGYCAAVSVTNEGNATAKSWSATLPIQGQVSTLWNGSYQQEGASLKLSGPDWNKDLAAGAQLNSIGFCANR